jgi:lycopene cyclase domain-containing protein
VSQPYLYLLIDFLSILFPLLFSFYPKHNFSKSWKHLVPAILLPGFLFIAWDEWFTQMGVWGFNPAYLTGIYFFSLPLEEILFFICIPYACVFTYEAVNYLIHWRMSSQLQNRITEVLILSLTITGFGFYDRWYTAVTFLLTSAFLSLHRWVWRRGYLGKFYLAFLFILIPFFIVNGILTGTGLEQPMVWYNDAENLGMRLGTIPVEDVFYGMTLLLMNVSIFESLKR